ncbi:MAG: hypothetical protein JST20_03045 [Bacteroidetes bacterium]|nr:hypothetical protein [Bacteroidota bacterium]
MKPGLFESIAGIISSAVGIVSVVKAHDRNIDRTGQKVECPCCLKDFNLVEDKITNCECTYCGATEQERFVWLYLQKRTRVLNGKLNLLWLSPDKSLGFKFKLMRNLSYSETKFSTLYGALDTSVRFESNYWDVAICIDDLSLNENDFHALVRLFRMMKPGGWIIMSAPLTQITNAGFIVHPIKVSEIITEDTATRFGISFEKLLYVSAKPESISWVDKRYSLNPIRQEKTAPNERILVSARFN